MSAIENTPEISFIDNKTVEDVRSEMVADYEEHMTQAQGVTVSLDRASVHRMILYAAAAQIYQAMQYIDRQGKQSLLKYSYSDYLDNLALFKGVTRSPATAATCTLRFTLAAERETATAIPQGTRVASSGVRVLCHGRIRGDPTGRHRGGGGGHMHRNRKRRKRPGPPGNCPPWWIPSPMWPA